jgi:hypothetical protein
VTLLLRRKNAQDRHEGREPLPWKDDDYAVLDGDRLIGRMYRERLPAGDMWMWFLHVRPAPPPRQGIADSLDQAKAEFAEAYKRCREANLPPTGSSDYPTNSN